MRTSTAGRHPERPEPDHLDPVDHLTLALSTVASFQASIRHADSKAGMLVAVQSGVVAIVAGKAAVIGAAVHAGSVVAVLAWLSTGLLTTGLTQGPGVVLLCPVR